MREQIKAQLSAEFLVFLGIAFLIAIAFIIASLEQLKDFRLQKESEAVKDLALKLQREVLIAANVEDGYVRVFQIPSKLENVDYTLAIQNSTIIVQSKNSAYIVSILNAIGNVSKGINIINKTSGVIYINSKLTSFFTSYSTCQNAENLGLCAGLDIIFGSGYRNLCCCEHSLCCTSPCT